MSLEQYSLHHDIHCLLQSFPLEESIHSSLLLKILNQTIAYAEMAHAPKKSPCCGEMFQFYIVTLAWNLCEYRLDEKGCGFLIQ